MNWLAHVFLSELNVDFQLGNYLADPLKGKAWESASQDLKNGLSTHKLIDSYTDSHISFKKSKNRIRKSGLLRSIVIDITYDYFLTKNWDRYSNIAFEEFTKSFYKEVENRLEYLPLHVKDVSLKIPRYKILNNYKNIEDLKIAFERFDKRLSPRLLSRDSASSYYEALVKNIDDLESDFLEFFPQLCNEVKKVVNSSKITHIK